MIEDLDQLVGSAVGEVFGTMLGLPILAQAPGTPITNGEANVAGAVGFIGTLTGVVYIYSSSKFARTLTTNLLGLEDKDIEGDEMVNDAVGELTNMIVGHMKSRLADRGITCALTIPSIVRGSHFSIEPMSTSERRVCTFNSGDNQVVVEVLVKPMQVSE